MAEPLPGKPRLIITADDWGYSPRYNDGILEAARAGALDSVGALVLRPGCDPEPLLECGVETGLHLEVGADVAEADTVAEPPRQAARFERLFGTPPAYIDGHHHCHSCPPALAGAVESLALELRVPVRAVDVAHRKRLRARGIACPDRLIGRLRPSEPALPAEIRAVLGGDSLPPGVTEWMVHPGQRDHAAQSSYDTAREEDLRLLLDLRASEPLLSARAGHAEALG